MASKKLFVSYTSADVEIASNIADELRGGGFSVTIQAVDFRPGSNFVLMMHTGIREADHLIAVLSPAYEASGFAAAEWAAAFVQDPTGDARKLIAVRVEDYRPGGLLAPIVYVDFVKKSWSDAINELRAALDDGDAPGTEQPGHRAEPTVPHRLRTFIGRDDELASLRTSLDEGRAVVITGLGGMGKTSLAAELVARGPTPRLLLWLNGTTDDRAESEAVRVAVQLGVASVEDEAATALHALRGLLQTSQGAVVVLDNCPNASLFERLFPELCCQLVVTSRNDRGWTTTGFVQLRIRGWTPEIGSQFLQAAAPEAGGEGAERIVSLLGGMPLALAQAATYVDIHGIALTEYLDRFAENAERLFSRPPTGDYDETVFTVCALTLDELDERATSAALVLKLLSFADPEEFPRSMFTIYSGDLPEPLGAEAGDPFGFDEVVSTLLANSLCRVTGDGISVHPVVQGVVRRRMTDEETRHLAAVFARILRQALPNRATPDTWPTWDRLGPHITSLAKSALEVSGYLQDLPPLVAELARVTAARGAPHLASDFLEGLVKYSSARRSEVPLDDAVTTAHNWATSLLELRDARRAVLVFREVVAMDAAAGDEPTPRSVGSMIGLANALMDTGEVEEGLVVIADASLVLESALSADDDVGIQLYGTWGRLLVAAGRSAEARNPLTRALERARRAHFVERAALCLTHLGNAALLDGELSEAEDWYEQGLVELEQLPEERYLRAVLLGGLASVLSAQGDVGGAIVDVDAGLAALAELPEGMHLAFAGSLKFKRAQLRLVNGTDVRDVITEAGEGFDLLCDHLPAAHPERIVVGKFLLRLAHRIQDDRLATSVLDREASLLQASGKDHEEP
jgi:tetratricopeptide (TPR) repeat protein